MRHLLACLWAVALTTAAAQADNILVEAEAFADHGDWVLDSQFMDQMGSPYLLAHGLGEPVKDATTTVSFPAAGEYRLWVRTKDWVAPWKAPGAPGKFQVLIDGKSVETVFGTEGAEWHWQDGGTVTIAGKSLRLALRDLTGFEGRCDAILLSSDTAFRPPDGGKELVAMRRQWLGLPARPEDAGKFDLVVVGGGYAGTCAALSAARQGLTVALIQDRPVLGGNGSSEVRVTPVGQLNQPPYPKLGNLVREVMAERNPNVKGWNYRQFTSNINEPTVFADETKERVLRAEKTLRLFLDTHVTAVEKSGSAITAVIGQHVRTGRELRFPARLFADCTGDGTVGFLAGADYRVGRESRDETGESLAPTKPDRQVMGATLMWFTQSCTNAPSQKGCECPPSPMWYTQPSTNAPPFPPCPWGLPFTDSSVDYATRGGVNWETGFAFDQVEDAERLRDYLFRAIYGNWSFVRNQGRRREDYRHFKLAWVPYVVGKRESRRLLGDVILRQQDIMEKRVFPDGCVTATWFIDLHVAQPGHLKHFPDEPFKSAGMKDYNPDPDPALKHNPPVVIPYRCLYSRNVNNLFMAGRDISVTHVALGSVRVMMTCGMMGEVVGMAAAVCKKHDTSPRGVYEKHLEEMKALLRGSSLPTKDGK